jgi:hypothetical protein
MTKNQRDLCIGVIASLIAAAILALLHKLEWIRIIIHVSIRGAFYLIPVPAVVLVLLVALCTMYLRSKFKPQITATTVDEIPRVPKMYLRDHFDPEGPIIGWHYNSLLGDLVPIEIRAYCPQCPDEQMDIGRPQSIPIPGTNKVRWVATARHRCSGRGYTVDVDGYGELTPYRPRIQERLANGQWRAAVERQIRALED